MRFRLFGVTGIIALSNPHELSLYNRGFDVIPLPPFLCRNSFVLDASVRIRASGYWLILLPEPAKNLIGDGDSIELRVSVTVGISKFEPTAGSLDIAGNDLPI